MHSKPSLASEMAVSEEAALPAGLISISATVERSKKIVVLASYEDASGAPMAALRLANGLQKHGHAVSAYFLYKRNGIDAPNHPYEIIQGEGRPRGLAYIRLLWRFTKTVRRIAPDIVVTYMPLANVIGQVSAVFAGVPKRVVSHRGPVDYYSPFRRSVDAALAHLGVYTDCVPVSEAVRASCQHYPRRLRDSTVVVYNGLLDWSPSALTKTEARRRLGLSEDDFVLVSVGRIVSQKNYLFLASIVARLSGVTLVIAGDGPLRPQLEEAVIDLGIADRVRLLGAVPRASVPDLLGAADLFVQPSVHEGHSNALLEALSAGVPALASDIPEQVEVLKGPSGEVAGELLPLTDPNTWVTAVEKFQRNPALLEKARNAAHLRAQNFSFERMIFEYKAILSRP